MVASKRMKGPQSHPTLVNGLQYLLQKFVAIHSILVQTHSCLKFQVCSELGSLRANLESTVESTEDLQ